MLDIKYIRENPEKVQEAVVNRGIKGIFVEDLLRLDSKRVDLLKQIDLKRNLRNKISEDVSRIKDDDARKKLIDEGRQVKEDISKFEKEYDLVNTEFTALMYRFPNIPSSNMPVGKGEEDNKVVKVWLPEKGYLKLDKDIPYVDSSYMPKTEFTYKDHVELGKKLDIIDVEQSAKVSGSRFCYLKNEAALLQDAVFALVKNKLYSMGYRPLVPPLLVGEKALYGTSHFPEGYDLVYKIENKNVEQNRDLYLVGSSEPSNFSYYMDKTLGIGDLPIRMYAQTTCFRSEVGSWGKDVRGIKRVHQFDKLEMNAVCIPEMSDIIFEEFLSNNEWLLQTLELPYRIINKCTGDAGYNASYFQYDIEGWRPGLKEFMELGTDTNTTDFQARRLNIKYLDQDGKAKFVHTVNDTGVAVGRMIIAIIENYQQKDGSILIPQALLPYMNGITKIEKK